MTTPTILVVDYEPNSLQKVKSLLESNSYKVETATDGLMAVKRFEEIKPNLVLLSAMLPKLHGFEACQKIKASSNGESVPVIIMTSIYKGRKYRHDALTKYGASEYLEKPFDDETLLGHIRALLQPGGARSRPQVDEDAEDVSEAVDDDDIPELLDEEEGEQTSIAPAASSRAAAPSSLDEEVEEEIVEEVEEIIGDDEQTVTVDPDVARAAIAAATAAAAAEAAAAQEQPPQRGLTSREIFSDVISEVEQEVGEPLKRIALERAAFSKDGARFLETGQRQVAPAAASATAPPAPATRPSATPAPPANPAATRPTSPAPPPPAPSSGSGRSRVRTAEVPPLSELLPAPTPRPTDAGRAAQDVFKQKLEETLTGLGIPVKKDTRRPRTQELPSPSMPEQAPAPRPRTQELPPRKAAEPPPSRPAPPPPPPPPVDEGVVFGNYTLIEKIAAGGMAELFKAKMQGVEGFRKLVAIKRILPHLTDNDEFVHMFIDEAKLAAQLNHQNIAHIFDLGRIDKFYYIAMEYVAGKDLRGILRYVEEKGERLPVELAVLIASKVAAALDYAHRKKDFEGRELNIVHRDISPQNVLLSFEGEVKLVDFGIAKAVSRSSQTESGTVKGKLLYMSPEQARGAEIDKRSDIFSLGVVLYEMLTGEKLFMDETEMDIIRKVRDCKVSSPRRLNPAIPKELELVVMTALEKRPEDRYQNAYKMQKDLENIMYAWESTPTSVNLAQFMAEEFGREAATADMDQTLLGTPPPAPPPIMREPQQSPPASRIPARPAPSAAPAPRSEPPRPAPPVAPPPPPPLRPTPEPEDDERTMLGDLDEERTVLGVPPPAPQAPPAAPPAPKGPTKGGKSGKSGKGGRTQGTAARAPSGSPGVILPDTGMIRVGKEEAVQELAGKKKPGGGIPPALLIAGIMIVVLVGVLAVAGYMLLTGSGSTETPTTPAATASPTTGTPATPGTTPGATASPSPAPTDVAASPTVAPPATVATPATTPAATPSVAPTAAATATPAVTPAVDTAKLARIEDNLKTMASGMKSGDWEATLRSADRVLSDDPKNDKALAAKVEAESKIGAKKQQDDLVKQKQREEELKRQKQDDDLRYAAALDAGRVSFEKGDLEAALRNVGDALKVRPGDGDATALRKQIQAKKREIDAAAKATPKPTEAATPAADPSAEWVAKIEGALAGPSPDSAEIEKMFIDAQSAGVPKSKLEPLYAKLQQAKPKPDANAFVPLGQLDVRPEPMSQVEPQYTRQAQLQKIQGTVIVEATIDASGDVVDTKVVRGLGSGLDEAAEKAVRKFKFKPGEKQGVKVKTTVTIPIGFKL